MEHEKFIKFLQEHAEIERVRTPATPAQRAPSEPAEIWRNGQTFTVTKSHNPTQNLRIKRLKPKTRLCEDCNLMVDDRVVNRKVYMFPERHWRETCETCRRVRNPQTGLFDIDYEGSQPVFIRFLANRNK